MKQLVSDLRIDIEQSATKLHNMLDDGVFDCLVKHPGDEPPNDNRLVLITITQDVRRMAYFERGYWCIFDLSGLTVRPGVESWQELPK